MNPNYSTNNRNPRTATIAPTSASSSSSSRRRAVATAATLGLYLLGMGMVTGFTTPPTTTFTSWPMTMKLSSSVSSSSSSSSNKNDSKRTSNSADSSCSSSLSSEFKSSPPSTTSRRPSSSSSSSSGIPKGSPLSMICKDQNDFELDVGHAMDTLKTDYQKILTQNPDFSIYDRNIEVIDPSGVKLHGISNYKNSFRLIHAIVNIFYCPERSSLSFKMCFDNARQNIRISWNAQVIPKAIFGGYKTTLHVDGISVYEISRNTGNITQHRVERLVINDSHIRPTEGIFSELYGYAKRENVGSSIPVFNSVMASLAGAAGRRRGDDSATATAATTANGNNVVRFQSFLPASRSLLFSRGSNPEELSSSSSSQTREGGSLELFSSSSTMDGNSRSNSDDNVDWDALEKKNAYRKKFGLEPLSPEEFMEIQEQVLELDSQQREKAARVSAEKAMASKKKEPGFLQKLFGEVTKDTCETNFDCQHPEVCCDFGFKKACCSSGMRIIDGPPKSREGQLAEVPVIARPDNYPPQGDQRYPGYPNY